MWSGITADKAISLTSGDKTISGSLTVSNIIYANSGILNLDAADSTSGGSKV